MKQPLSTLGKTNQQLTHLTFRVFPLLLGERIKTKPLNKARHVSTNLSSNSFTCLPSPWPFLVPKHPPAMGPLHMLVSSTCSPLLSSSPMQLLPSLQISAQAFPSSGKPCLTSLTRSSPPIGDYDCMLHLYFVTFVIVLYLSGCLVSISLTRL